MDFCLLLKNVGKNLGKSISKNLSGEYSQKLLDHAKQSATDALKTASKKKTIQKKAEAVGDLIFNKIKNKNYKSQEIRYRILQIQLKDKQK